MTRQEAWDACSQVGAIAEKTTTKRTNVLVIGGLGAEALRPGAKLSAKAQKTVDLMAKGQDIELMDEDDFLRCLT